MRARSFFLKYKRSRQADQDERNNARADSTSTIFCKLPYKTILIFVNRREHNTKRHGQYATPAAVVILNHKIM